MATTLTYTAGDLCTAALRKAKIVGIDRASEADEMDVAIVSLNLMLKALQIPSVMIWKQTTGSITLTDATTSYTISSRPLKLGVVNWRDTDARDLPMLELTREEYYELPDKDAAGQPTQYYYHRLEESGVLYVWPVQTTASGTIEWEGRAEIDDVTATTDAIDVPAEWYEAIVYQLAVRLTHDFDVTSNPEITALAERALTLAQSFERESVYFMPDFEHG